MGYFPIVVLEVLAMIWVIFRGEVADFTNSAGWAGQK